MHDTDAPTQDRALLVGNRLVLVGAILYLLEWVAIIAAHLDAPLGADTSTSHVASAYGAHPQLWGWAAGWFSVVLLGRILIMTGLRSALSDSDRSHPLMEIAVAAMAVGVVLEIATYALVSGASWALIHGAQVGTVQALDAAAFQLNQMLFGPTGVAVLCAGIAMWHSGLFPRVLSGLGLVAGALVTVVGLALVAPKYADLAGALTTAVVLFWVWMLWTGVLVWRARPSR